MTHNEANPSYKSKSYMYGEDKAVIGVIVIHSLLCHGDKVLALAILQGYNTFNVGNVNINMLSFVPY